MTYIYLPPSLCDYLCLSLSLSVCVCVCVCVCVRVRGEGTGLLQFAVFRYWKKTLCSAFPLPIAGTVATTTPTTTVTTASTTATSGENVYGCMGAGYMGRAWGQEFSDWSSTLWTAFLLPIAGPVATSTSGEKGCVCVGRGGSQRICVCECHTMSPSLSHEPCSR